MILDEGQDSETIRPYVVGKGSWAKITPAEWERATQVAQQHWAPAMAGIDYPWLCWNVDDPWCLVQQRMVRAVGWTPVVGFDPRVGPPPLVEGAVLIDFNEGLNLPAMSMMFPLELVYLFAPRLAFWHSDLLIRERRFRGLAQQFRSLPDGETAAVDVRARWYRRILGERGRYWELVGCTTRGASRAQFEAGCGWWRKPSNHINCTNERDRRIRENHYYDHGVGILLWQKFHGGLVRAIPAKPIEEGHCSRIGNKGYRLQSPNDQRRDLSKDLSFNYDLAEVCARLDLAHYLGQGASRRRSANPPDADADA